MDTIRFVAKDQNQAKFAKELSKRVRAHFKEKGITTCGDYRMILKAVLLISLYAIPFLLIFMINMPVWMAFILVVLMGVGEAGIGMAVMHDAVHGSFSKHAWVNKLMGSSIYLLGSNVVNWRIQHNLFHHTYPNVSDWDGDIEAKGMLRLSVNDPQKKIYRYQHYFGPFIYGLMTLGRFFGELGQLKDFKRRGALELYKINYNWAAFKLISSKLIYLFVILGLPIIFTDFAWWQILIGFVVMHVTASIIMGTIFQLAHVVEGVTHPVPDEKFVMHNHHMVHQLLTSSDFGNRKGIGLLSWYIGGLDYQVVHHLFPSICHLHYPELAKIVKETTTEFNQPYISQGSLPKAFRSHLRTLKALGQAN